MNYLVLPAVVGQSSVDGGNSEWAVTTEVTLNGFFYDHVCTADGAIAGVRYWIEPGTEFDRHPVFSLFLEDERFRFNPDDGYVDIVFDREDVDALKTGVLEVQTVQDFGGENVVRKGDLLGIAFDL